MFYLLILICFMPNPNGAVAGNAQNIPVAHVPRSRSTFPLAYEFPHSDRFGEYVPHLAEDVNKDEYFPIRSQHEIRSYTMKSPLMQNVRRNKDYFFVPSMAILPRNWNKFFDHPVRGDDVLDDVGPTVENFWSRVSGFMVATYSSFQTILSDSATTNELALQTVLRYLVIGEYFYSNGNLLAYLNCHGSPYCVVSTASGHAKYPNPISWDRYFDEWIGMLRPLISRFTLSVDGFNYIVADYNPGPGWEAISWRHALSLIRDNPTASVVAISLVGNTPLKTEILNFQSANFDALTFCNANVPCKLEKLWAYQLVVAHYFSNDHIDYIYSAELYRELIGNYCRTWADTSYSTRAFFTMNGVKYEYDYLSAHWLTALLQYFSTSNLNLILFNSSAAIPSACLGYLSALFGFRRSLRYLDYFTGSRAQPLAVQGGNSGMSTDVAVVNNSVSVIDITKKIQAQRFRNSVNRIRQQAEAYLKGVFGGSMPAPDYHNPFYLAHTSDVIYGQETENTASEQIGSQALPIAITTNLRGTSGNYVFEANTDRPGIIIGITSYDITRIYTKSMDRSFFHTSRYDWFNPFLQYIGDQEVWLQELGIKPNANSLNTMTPFAYALRHMEYKQKYSYAAGAFCEEGILPGWIFVASDKRGSQGTINPDWIRSVPAEFDRFYISLAGYSLATYFHFIVKDFNSTNASRPMSYSPQILG